MTRSKQKTKKHLYTQDYYAKQAREKNFLARSIFKLEEIDSKYKIIKKGHRILDLGASPGSWTQYILQKIDKNGKIIAVDLHSLKIHNMEQFKNLIFIKKDIFQITVDDLKKVCDSYDLVLSDMAPATIGDKFVDHQRSVELFNTALCIAKEILREGGTFLGKIFQGEDFDLCRKNVKELFNEVKIIRPVSTRKESHENFILGTNFIFKKNNM